jgi:hypothetical protein
LYASYHHKRLTDAFVDDTLLAITDTYNPMSPHEMIHRIEKIAQNWERLLFLSGGSLNLKKCSWSMLHWEWTNGCPHLYRRKDYDADITLVTRLPQEYPQSQLSNISQQNQHDF